MQLIDPNPLNTRLSTLDRLARSDAQSALLGRVFYILQTAPTIEAEPVRHGRWIEQEGYDGDVYYSCSACGCDWICIDGTPEENDMHYCPKCGAKMDGG